MSRILTGGSVVCPVCDGRRFREITVANKCLLVCLDCNYIFLKAVGANAINPNWHEDSAEFYFSGSYDWRSAVIAWKPRVVELRQLLPAFPRIRVLDYGSGAGFLVKAFEEAGCQAEGIEISPGCLDFGRETLKVPMRSLDEFAQLYQGGELTRSFDLVTSYHVLEHLDDPRELRGQVAKMLRPGGVWSIEIPNILSYESIKAGHGWSGLSLGIHRGFMVEKTMRTFLSKGFAICSMRCSVAHEFYSDFLPYLQLLATDDQIINDIAAHLSGTVLVVNARRL